MPANVTAAPNKGTASGGGSGGGSEGGCVEVAVAMHITLDNRPSYIVMQERIYKLCNVYFS